MVQYTGARIDEELKEKIRVEAAKRGVSQSDLFRRAVENEIERSEHEEKEIGEVYEDRNLLACALTIATVEDSGWKIADDAEGWAIVWIEFPTGQVSWHVPLEMAEEYVTNYERVQYDGYDREEKNDRLQEWMEGLF